MKTMDQWQTCVWLPGVETKREWSEMGILEIRIVTCVVVTIFCDTQNDVLGKSERNEHQSICRIRSSPIDC